MLGINLYQSGLTQLSQYAAGAVQSPSYYCVQNQSVY